MPDKDTVLEIAVIAAVNFAVAYGYNLYINRKYRRANDTTDLHDIHVAA